MNRDLQFANLGLLFTTALIPFPTAVVSQTLTEGIGGVDARTSVVLYALIAAAMCASWLVLYGYLHRHHADFVKPTIADDFFANERKRAIIGITGYAVAGLIGAIIAPVAALVIFVLLPIFCATTSEGLSSRRRAVVVSSASAN